jgi:hypothetical protein
MGIARISKDPNTSTSGKLQVNNTGYTASIRHAKTCTLDDARSALQHMPLYDALAPPPPVPLLPLPRALRGLNAALDGLLACSDDNEPI